LADHDHTALFAGLGTADLGVATAWYERLLGRPPDLIPNDREVAWELTDGGWIYVVADTERAGRGRLTLLVADLDAHLAALSSRGIEPESTQDIPATVRKAELRDPDGNALTLGQPL
jgi:hypothetical protein